MNKNYEKKRKIMESEVTNKAMKQLNINEIVQQISELEQEMGGELQSEKVQQLMGLYNKAIEYYSAFNDEKHFEYLQKLQQLFKNDQVQTIIED